MHGGASTGPGDQTGNQNARKHGLFSAALTTDIGLATYEAAKEKPSQELARDSAEFIVAKVVEAFQGEPETHPNLLVLSAALGKLKGLLEVRDEAQDDGGDLAEAIQDAADAGATDSPLEGEP